MRGHYTVLYGATGGTIDTHALSEYTGRDWTVVLVFYPFDIHPACTGQQCSLRDADWLTLLDDVVVLGVGTDGAYAHREYAAEHNIGFPLLSDTAGGVSRAYGVPAGEVDGHRDVPERATFVVDPDRVVQFARSADGPEDWPDTEALREVTECRDGEYADEST